MANCTCETIRLGLGSDGPWGNLQVLRNGQSLQATRAAVAATCYRALWRKTANGNGKMSADGQVVEVWHV